MSTTLVEKVHGDISLRLNELEPLVEEHRQLSAIAEKLGVVSKHNGNGSKRTARKTTSATRSSGRRGRPAGSGKRGQEVVDIVQANSGITISEIARKMKIKPNYLYRVLPGLEKEGKVKKNGKGYEAASSVASEASAE